VRRHFKPYASEIGQLSLAWNSLHENLAHLFWFAIGPERGRLSFAIWNKLSNDRLQRDILKTVIEARAFHSEHLTKEILWLLKQVDSLSEQRNVGIHAPLTTLTDLETGITRVAPLDFFGNKRAKSLKEKEILKELTQACEMADTLSRFAVELIPCISGRRHPSWPERPELPFLSNQNRQPERPQHTRSRRR